MGKKSLRLAIFAAAASAMFIGGPATAAVHEVSTGSVTPNTCAYPSWHNTDPNAGIVQGYGVKMHTGPYGACAALPSSLSQGQKLQYHCEFKNAYGNWWIHSRLDGYTMQGWVYWGDVKPWIDIYPCY